MWRFYSDSGSCWFESYSVVCEVWSFPSAELQVNTYVSVIISLQSCQPLRFSVLHYARTLKTTINLPFPVIVLCGAVLSLSPVQHSVYGAPHTSSSTPHGLKTFAAPANRNGAFFSRRAQDLWGDVFYLCMRSSL
jgi:hypothetical protein